MDSLCNSLVVLKYIIEVLSGDNDYLFLTRGMFTYAMTKECVLPYIIRLEHSILNTVLVGMVVICYLK